MTTSLSTDPLPAGQPVATRALWPIMVSLVLALIPVQMDALVAATAVPTIAGELGGFDRIAWIATSYLLAMAIGTIVSGRLGDMFGRRPLLLIALGVFFVGSLWAGLSTGMTELIAARAVQGLGAGMTFTTLLAVVADVVPPEKRARYQGIFGAVAPISMILGPWIGGVITDHLSWRWIFLLNLPLVGISLLGVLLLLKLPRTHLGGTVDFAGLGAITVASAGIVLAVSWGGHQYEWLSWPVTGATVIAAVALAVLILVERRAENPVLPLDLFRNRAVLMSFLVMFLGTGAVMMGSMNFLPVFLQVVQGQSAGNSGLLLLPLLLPAIAVAVLIGGWTGKGNRYRPVMITGTALLALAAALLATMGAETASWVTAGYMLIAGIGVGMLFQTPLVLVQNSSPQTEVGAATGAASFLRTIGGAIGVGALGAVFANAFAGYLANHPDPATTGLDVAQLSPARLLALPASAHQIIVDGAAAANSALFWAAAVVALLAVAAAIAVPRLRRTAEVPEPAPV